MRRIVLSGLTWLSGNKLAQHLLGLNVLVSQYLMGIGSGSVVESSGEASLWNRMLRPEGSNEPLCIFDVGANEGQFLDQLRRGLEGLPFHVHVFEPSGNAFKILQDKAGTATNVTLNNIGLGRTRGQFELFSEKAGSPLGSLYRRRLDHFGIDFKLSDTVTIATLDEYCSERGVERIDLLKLDVEGHELEVLRGCLRMFEGRRVRMVSFEFGGCNIDSRTFLQDFYYFFKEHGMASMFRITPSGYLWPIRDYRELDEQFRTTNFLVVMKPDR